MSAMLFSCWRWLFLHFLLRHLSTTASEFSSFCIARPHPVENKSNNNNNHSMRVVHSLLRNYPHMPRCPPPITASTLDLTPTAPVWHPRHASHPDRSQPHVSFAAVFNYNGTYISNNVGATFKIAMPMYNAEHYVKRSLQALLEHTTGVWSLDLVVDFSLDDSLRTVLHTLLLHLSLQQPPPPPMRPRLHRHRHLLAQRAAQPHMSRTDQSQEQGRLSYPAVIRVLVSDGFPLFETRAENIAFSTSPLADYYVSVQADMVVKVRGWNELLVLPLLAFQDAFSVSGHCAHNLKSPADRARRNASSSSSSFPASNSSAAAPQAMRANNWHNVGHCMAADLQTLHEGESTLNTSAPSNFSFHGFSGDQLRRYFVRTSSNRGPLVFRGRMMRTLGFLDELNWMNGNDDHDIHVRAYIHGRWVTGFFELPFEHITRDKHSEEVTRHELAVRHDRLLGNSSSSGYSGNSGYAEVQQQVVESFVRHRDGGFTSWKFRGNPILHRNTTFYRDKILAQKIPAHQPDLRSKGMFAAHSAHLPISESTRVLSDSMLLEASRRCQKHTSDLLSSSSRGGHSFA